jgi:hypothetical protein
MSKKRTSIFGRSREGLKPAYGESPLGLPGEGAAGEGHFWKRGQNLPHTWRRREYKLREDAVMFYFDGDRLKGQVRREIIINYFYKNCKTIIYQKILLQTINLKINLQ